MQLKEKKLNRKVKNNSIITDLTDQLKALHIAPDFLGKTDATEMEIYMAEG